MVEDLRSADFDLMGDARQCNPEHAAHKMTGRSGPLSSWERVRVRVHAYVG
jgi:hypothetical protein